MRKWMRRAWCVITGGHRIVEMRKTQYIPLHEPDGEVSGHIRLPFDVVTKHCTRCG